AAAQCHRGSRWPHSLSRGTRAAGFFLSSNAFPPAPPVDARSASGRQGGLMKLAAALRPALALVGLALSTCNRDQPLAPASPRGGTPRFEVAPSNSTMPTWIDLAPSGGPPDAL